MAPNDEHHYDTQQYAGDQAARTRYVMNHMPDEDRSTTQELQRSINQSQAADLTAGVRMGDDRVISDTPNWESFESEALYRFATQQNSPTTADDLGRAFNAGGNSLAEAANGLFDAVARLDGAWSGVAADSARAALAPLARAAGLAGQTAQLMGVRMSQQSVAATEVRKLPPPKAFDPQQSLDAMVAGGPAAMQQDLKAQKDAADAVKREQIAYLNAYTTSMTAVDAQTPSFVPPEETISGGGGNGGRVTGGTIHVPATGAPTLHGTTTGAPSGGYTGVAGPNSGYDAGDSDQTDQSTYTPLPGLNTGTSGYTTPTGTAPVASGPAFGQGPGGGPGAPGAGAGGFGGGFGSFGGGPGQSGGTGAGGQGGTGNAGPRGMAPGGVGGAAGRGGPGGMAGAPRGRSDGEEDGEHERPAYLLEGDAESTFGSDQLTAPAVIGGDDA